MKHGSTLPVIGVLISDIESTYQESFFEELCSQAGKRQIKPVIYSGTVVGTSVWFERQLNIAYHLAHPEHLDGVLSVTSTFMRQGTEPVVQRLLEAFSEQPRVSVTVELTGVPSIRIDNVTGFRQLLEHLIHEHGYRDFAFLSGPAGSHEAQQRLRTFRTVMAENAIRVDPRLIQDGDFSYAHARAGAERILASGLPVRVIVAANDEMAMAVFAIAAKRGLRIPEDLAVVGVDDLHPHVTGLRLSTVNNALDQQIDVSLDTLMRQIRGETVPMQVTVPTRPVFRQSCGCTADLAPLPLGVVDWAAKEAAVLDSLALNARDRLHFERYLLQCLDALASEEPRALERVVWEIARETLSLSGGVLCLQSLLLGIQTHLLDPEALSAHDLWRLGIQFSQAHVALLKAKATHSVAQGEMSGISGGSINRFKRELLSFEIHQQMENLPDLLGQFGIRTCIIAFYEEQGYFNTSNDYLLPGSARLVACLVDGKRYNDQLWQPFDTKQLLPDSVWALTGASPLIVMPAFQQAGHYGYMLFGAERPVGVSLESVREAISSALIGSLLVEEIGRVRDYLAKVPKRLARTSHSIDRITSHDPVSGLFNRQGFVDEARKRFTDVALGHQLLIYASIHGLDSIEASLGRTELDFAIGESAQVFASMLRASDLVARIEPTRFVALCADTHASFFGELEHRLRKAFEEFNQQSNRPYQINCTLACRNVVPSAGQDFRELLELPV